MQIYHLAFLLYCIFIWLTHTYAYAHTHAQTKLRMCNKTEQKQNKRVEFNSMILICSFLTMQFSIQAGIKDVFNIFKIFNAILFHCHSIVKFELYMYIKNSFVLAKKLYHLLCSVYVQMNHC